MQKPRSSEELSNLFTYTSIGINALMDLDQRPKGLEITHMSLQVDTAVFRE